VLLAIDTEARTLVWEAGGERRQLALYSKEAFEALSTQWLRLGWSLGYYTNLSWLGTPIQQLPEDLIRVQEVIHRLRPDVIVETGVLFGGSLVYYASLCRLVGRGRVIGIDVAIRPEARRAVSSSPLSPLITLLEGSSTDPAIVERVRRAIRPGETVLVLLDSDHSKAHVAAELEAYHPLVTPGSYLVVADGIMADLGDVPGGDPAWAGDHPGAAAAEFAARHPEFALEQPAWPTRAGALAANVTYWPGGWLRREGGAGPA